MSVAFSTATDSGAFCMSSCHNMSSILALLRKLRHKIVKSLAGGYRDVRWLTGP